MKILDCTLRDGGYYNNWDFDSNLVESYLNSMAKAGIDFVELGLRNFAKDQFAGAFAYTTEDFLNSIVLPDGPMYGVMVDAKTIIQSSYSCIKAVDELFTPSKDSKIGLVRVAAHFHEIEQCGDFIQHLKHLGYLVGFNLMQSGGKSDELLKNAANTISTWNAVDCLYFADSLGNMDVIEVERITRALQSNWFGELGIHTHNNMGKALDNTMAANKIGVNWLDVTVTGMGRGAGNAQTENLLAILNSSNEMYQAEPVYELVIKYFSALQKVCGWGSSMLYFIGAKNNVHPTYIQTLLSDVRIDSEQIVGAINYLAKNECSSFNGDILEKALIFDTNSEVVVSGSEYLKDRYKGKPILIVGNGDSTIKHSKAISLFIEKVQPIVLAVNISKSLPASLINYYVVSHNSKYLVDKDKYGAIKNPIILPFHRFSKQELEKFYNPIDYGITVKSDTFIEYDAHCVIPAENTAAYALAIAATASCSKVFVVGFDGYERGDERQMEMTNVLVNFRQTHPNIDVISLTPSTYPIKGGSVYAPIK
tara:strand:- start:7413 stop:9020 length:1608 start_codon:yes stop_codon:yes gene_type:complete